MDGELSSYIKSVEAPIVHEYKINEESKLLVDKNLFLKLEDSPTRTNLRQSKSTSRKVKKELQHQPNLQKVMNRDVNVSARSEYLAIEKEADGGMLRDDDSFYSTYARYNFFRHSVADKYFEAAEKAIKLGDTDDALRLFKKSASVYDEKLGEIGCAIHVLKEGINALEILGDFEELYQDILRLYAKDYEIGKKELKETEEAGEETYFDISGISHNLIGMADIYEKINGDEELIKRLYNEAGNYLIKQEDSSFNKTVSCKFAAAVCYEKAQNYELANEIYKQEYEEYKEYVDGQIRDFNVRFDELNKLTDEEAKEDLNAEIVFGFVFFEPVMRAAKALALKTNNLDQFSYFSEIEIEMLGKIIKSLIFSQENGGAYYFNEFIEEASQVSDLDDYWDVIDWSFIDVYVELAESYALKCDQINPEKATQIRNKITEVKEYFQFDQLKNFTKFFDDKVEKAIEAYIRLNSDFQGSAKNILDLFDNESLVCP